MKQSKSAGGIVVNKNKKIVVVNQKGISWSFPKGHIKNGKDKLDTAKREIYEESGITDLKLIRELGGYQRYKISNDGKGEDKTNLKIIYMFLFHSDKELLKPVDRRILEAKWMPKERVADLLTHPKDKEFFLSIIDKI